MTRPPSDLTNYSSYTKQEEKAVRKSAGAYTDDLRLAHILADSVDALTMSRFKAQDLKVETKADSTPVTDADKAAEELIRAQLGRYRTRDSILGEEFGVTGSSNRQWIIDPIDGTKNFMRGVPVWATLIALVEDGVPVVGVVSAPALGRRWWASQGSGAYTGRSLAQATQIQVSGVQDLADASLSYSSLTGWEQLGKFSQFKSLTDLVWRTRAYGDFWSYVLVAEGVVDIALEPELNLYDMAALVPIVVEAGGTFTSVDGSPAPYGPNALATNGLLHGAVLHMLNDLPASASSASVLPERSGTPSDTEAPSAAAAPAESGSESSADSQRSAQGSSAVRSPGAAAADQA